MRQVKSENKRAMNSEISLTLSKEDYKELGDLLDDLKGVTCATQIEKGKFGVGFV